MIKHIEAWLEKVVKKIVALHRDPNLPEFDLKESKITIEFGLPLISKIKVESKFEREPDGKEKQSG
ncbi:MAG: hypothetical protein J7J91_06735 [Deltaproteobacteria bacterium]|nr:hypothetical protein [Deltaproteobacteria bacterium]